MSEPSVLLSLLDFVFSMVYLSVGLAFIVVGDQSQFHLTTSGIGRMFIAGGVLLFIHIIKFMLGK